MVPKKNRKFVEVSEQTHDRLGDFGKKNESYGEIVTRLLDTVEELQGKKQII